MTNLLRRGSSALPNGNCACRQFQRLGRLAAHRFAPTRFCRRGTAPRGNVSIPVFNGFLYSADAKEAKLRAQAAQEDVRNLRDMIARDVRMAVLNAKPPISASPLRSSCWTRRISRSIWPQRVTKSA